MSHSTTINDFISIDDMTPAEVDTVIADDHRNIDRYRATIDSLRRYLPPSPTPYMLRDIEPKIALAEQAIKDLKVAVAPFEAVYRENPWNRYFLVNNTNGHVHRGMNCSTCFPTTQYQWLIDLADTPAETMVSTFGEMACTVCFPEAPTMTGFGDGTSALARYSEVERQAKVDAKTVKAIAKAAKAITAPDGTPLRDHTGGILKTERSARIEITRCLENLIYGYNESNRDTARRIAAAVAAKHDLNPEAVLAEHQVKAAKKVNSR